MYSYVYTHIQNSKMLQLIVQTNIYKILQVYWATATSDKATSDAHPFTYLKPLNCDDKLLDFHMFHTSVAFQQ